MSVVKSDIIKELADNYPNFLRKDLTKLVDIILYEMQNSLKCGERVELRDIFTLDPKIQKEGIRRNPKTGEKVFIKEKKSVLFKMSKEWAAKINEKE
ncbi:integration host factor subunit beta [Candidatus Pelagibacter sp.]|nr:integration host factor subunit beta [Candidatus Pelagibacter sp.]